MTNKERVLKTLTFQPVDHFPFSVLNGQMWICAHNGLTAASILELPEAGAKLLVDTYNEMGTEIMFSGCGAPWPMISAMGGTVDMNTLAGEIITHPLHEVADIRKFDLNNVILEMKNDYYYQRTLVQIRKMREYIGDSTMIGGGFFGPFTLAAQMIGVEDFMVELLDAEEEDIKAIIDFSVEIVISYLEDLIDNGLDLITIPEPVASGDLISPEMFEEYVLPADKKVIDRLANKCSNNLIHICGKTDRIIEKLAAVGMRIVSVDSINLVEAKEKTKGCCTLFGNLNPALVLSEKTPEEVYEISSNLCTQLKAYGGFILAPGCDLSPNIPLENIQAMAKAAKDNILTVQ